MQNTRLLTVSAALLCAGTLAACGSSTPSSPATSTGGAGATAPAAKAAVTVSDTWVKASDAKMTGLFGVITNHTDKDVTVTSATSPVAGMVELHEVVSDGKGATKMQEKKGGFVIKAGQSYTLKPGADHIMLMKLKNPVKPGDKVNVTLSTQDGASVGFEAVAKTFAAGNEVYEPGKGGVPGTGMPTGHGSMPTSSTR